MPVTPCLPSVSIVLDLLYVQTGKFEQNYLGHKTAPPQFDDLLQSYALIENDFCGLIFDSHHLGASITSLAGFLTQAIAFHATIDRRINEVLNAKISQDGEWAREELKLKARDFCADVMDEVIAPAYKIANLKDGRESAYKACLRAAKIRGTVKSPSTPHRPIALGSTGLSTQRPG